MITNDRSSEVELIFQQQSSLTARQVTGRTQSEQVCRFDLELAVLGQVVKFGLEEWTGNWSDLVKMPRVEPSSPEASQQQWNRSSLDPRKTF